MRANLLHLHIVVALAHHILHLIAFLRRYDDVAAFWAAHLVI